MCPSCTKGMISSGEKLGTYGCKLHRVVQRHCPCLGEPCNLQQRKMNLSHGTPQTHIIYQTHEREGSATCSLRHASRTGCHQGPIGGTVSEELATQPSGSRVSHGALAAYITDGPFPGILRTLSGK